MLQDNVLLNRSIIDNISLANPGMSVEKVIYAAKLAGAHDFISDLREGYNTIVGNRGQIIRRSTSTHRQLQGRW
ncbi:alpha-hemolysin translocation ATP-binding protein HlyB [Escherichia coli]|nr:alpha-hemolysin translocation ATP-binding protein HlyB [Escherichia coli]